MRIKSILAGCCAAGIAFLLLHGRAGREMPQPDARKVFREGRVETRSAAPQQSSNPPAVQPSGASQGAPADFRAWLTAWRSAGAPVQDQDLLAAGRELAILRRIEMLRWIEENPARALAESLSWSEWAALPEALNALVEKPFSARADFAVLPNCPPGNPALPKVHSHSVNLDGRWHDAWVFGRKAAISAKDDLPVRGILLDGKVALAEAAVEVLSAEDAQAAATHFPSAAAAPAGPDERTILLGGTVYRASEVEVAALEELLERAEGSLHPKAVAMALSAGTGATGVNSTGMNFDFAAASEAVLRASSTWTETPKSVLAVRINYSDAAAYSFTLNEMTNLLVNASNAVKVLSYGKTWLVPRIASVTLPKTRQAYQLGGSDLIATDTRTALSGIGINRDAYHIVVHAHPGMSFSYAGLGVIGGANNWLNGKVSVEVAVHEIGHNYGLLHAHFWAGVTGLGSLGRTQADDSLVEKEEYGDPFDIMGGSTLPAGQFNAHGKAALNWIEQNEVIQVVTNGVYRVYRFDHKDARTNSAAKLALKVVSPGGDEYWISHRRLFTANSSLSRGANIVRADGTAGQRLIDTTPFSRPSRSFAADREDSALAIGKSFSDPLETVRITTLAAGGSAPLEYLDVQVEFLNASAYSFYTSQDFATNGLVGSYINRSLITRFTQDDWRSGSGVTVAGQRVDPRLHFTSDGWGARAPLRLTGGSDANWENFSVQWDGYVVVRRPVRLATTSDDSSRFWIDLDGNSAFGLTAPEYVNNHWGTPQGPTRGQLSPVIPPGTYAIRIQYQEGAGGNYFVMEGADIPFEVFLDAEGATPGLEGSYIARSLRSSLAQNDWRATQTVAGTRIDSYPGFTVSSLGKLAEAGLAAGVNGSDADWDNFSVQWDGYLKVYMPVRMATISDDHSRMWIDLNTNGTFSTTAPEYINNGWGGSGQGMSLGQLSVVIQPGVYAMRIQYEEGGGGNGFLLAGIPQGPADAPVLFNALTLGGAENRLVPSNLSGDFTLQFWIQTTQMAGAEGSWTEGMGIIDGGSNGAEPAFGASLGNGKIVFGMRDGLEQSITSGFVADGQWHHVSARWEQATGAMTLFVDGREVARGIGPVTSLETIMELTIGSRVGGSQYFNGILDQVRTWTTARSDAQVAADYHAARISHGFADAAPVLHLKTGEKSVQVSWDAISSYRRLEGATRIDGEFQELPTDQNSTNIVIGLEPMRYFRVRR